MSNRKGSRSMEKAWKTLVIANLCLWIYFWAAFAHASYPFLPDRLGHPAGTAYAFWGYSIAVVESGLVYPFFKVVFYAEFSAFALATLTAQGLSPHLLLNGFFGGISGGGWLLLGVMVLSFFEWYLWLGGRHRSCGKSGSVIQLGFGITLRLLAQRPGRHYHPSLSVSEQRVCVICVHLRPNILLS